MFGQAGLDGIAWGDPVKFSNESQAFGVSLVEMLEGNNFAISFRDQNQGGTGLLLSGQYDPDSGSVTFSPAVAYARHQAQNVALLSMPHAKVAVVFSEHEIYDSQQLRSGQMYGSAVLAQVEANHAPQILRKHRFFGGPVARLSATRLSPSDFVVAYRGGAEATNKHQKQEAAYMLAGMRGAELLFDPHPISLEPDMTQIWSRSLSLVDEGIVSYTYHSGREEVTKQALLRLNPSTRKLEVAHGPEVVAEGFTPYVGSVSTSLVQRSSNVSKLRSEPRLLTYFAGVEGFTGRGRFCHVSSGMPEGCVEMPLTEMAVTSAVSSEVGDGRALLVFTDTRGIPHYKMIGLLDAY
jgi:hypothetical protein